MKLTKEQDKLATRLRDAGIPGDFAVLVASRASRGFLSGPIEASYTCFFWDYQQEGYSFWDMFCKAWIEECDARGIK